MKFISKQGRVTWDSLKKELMELPKETLVDMVDMWVKNYWTNQNYWMIMVERDFGEEVTGRLDSEIWQQTAKAQAHRIKRVLNLGNDIQALATALKFTAPQWINAGFAWEFVEVSDTRLVMRVNKCPMGTYRGELGLPIFPCKIGSPPLYIALAKVINEHFTVTCLHAHPDEPRPGVMCEWEFKLEE